MADEKKGGEVSNTHAVTTPNKRPATPIEVLRGNLEGEFLQTVQSYYSGNKEQAMMFKTAAVDYVRKVPKLLECDRISLMSALVQAAQFRFMPSGVNGECYIIPYGNEAKFQLGYQGLVTLLWRSDQIKSVNSLIVYENEEFEYSEGLETTLRHIPTRFGEKKGKAIGVYAVAQTTKGGRVFKVMSADDVMAIKNLSKAKGSKESPWNSDKDPELWMWKKTCLIQLSKLLPKTKEIQDAIAADFDGEGIKTAHVDAGGPGVGRSLHSPDAYDGVDAEPEANEEEIS